MGECAVKLEYLRYMLVISKCGSISSAAQKLYVTQPYLSKCIKEVEHELKITIFIRQNKGIIPTEQGHQFLLHAARLVNEMDSLMHLYDNREKEYIEFSLSTVRSSLVMDCFLQFLDGHAGENYTKFHIREGSNTAAINDVYTHASCLGIVQIHNAEHREFLARLKAKNICYHKIRSLDRQIILSIHHPLIQAGRPICVEDLYHYGLVRYESGLLFGNENADNLWYNTLVDLNRIPNQILVSDRASLNNILAQTDYFTVGTSPSLKQEDVHNIISVPLNDGADKTSYTAEMGYIHLENAPLTHLAHQFIEMLCQAYA